MGNKNISSTNGHVGFLVLFVNMELWILDPISLWTRGQDTSGEKSRQIAFFPIKSDEELPYTI